MYFNLILRQLNKSVFLSSTQSKLNKSCSVISAHPSENIGYFSQFKFENQTKPVVSFWPASNFMKLMSLRVSDNRMTLYQLIPGHSYLSRSLFGLRRWNRKQERREDQQWLCIQESFCFFHSIYHELCSTWECRRKWVIFKKGNSKDNAWETEVGKLELPTCRLHPEGFPSPRSHTNSHNRCIAEG